MPTHRHRLPFGEPLSRSSFVLWLRASFSMRSLGVGPASFQPKSLFPVSTIESVYGKVNGHSLPQIQWSIMGGSRRLLHRCGRESLHVEFSPLGPNGRMESLLSIPPCQSLQSHPSASKRAWTSKLHRISKSYGTHRSFPPYRGSSATDTSRRDGSDLGEPTRESHR